MSAIALDPLIAEAKRRMRRRRWLLGLVVSAVIAGTAVGVASIAGRPAADSSPKGIAATTSACGITAAGTQILQNGQAVYREPGHVVHPNGGPPPQVQCSGGSIWVVWPFQGAGMMQEAYFGVRSSDGGRTWRAVFSEGYYGPKAPHQLDAYFGPWTLRGNAAYFAGSCPACSIRGISSTVSLYVTKDGGRTFHTYGIRALTGFAPASISVSGHSVTVVGKRVVPGLARHKTAAVRVG